MVRSMPVSIKRAIIESIRDEVLRRITEFVAFNSMIDFHSNLIPRNLHWSIQNLSIL